MVSVERVIFHCSKCMIRSHPWDPASRSDPAGIPTLAEALIAHSKLAEPLADIEQLFADDTVNRLS